MNRLESLPITVCPECVRLRRELDAALSRIVKLETQVGDLCDQLRRNSSNSSTPPSANPLNAPKPPAKTPTGKKRGGQPGHPGHHRLRLPADRVDNVVRHVPTSCIGCQASLSDEPGPDDPEPAWHQVAELPITAAIVTEHQAHARTCPQCGLLNHAVIPAEIRAHAFGPRLAATMSYFSSRFHVSRRAVVELLDAVFDLPASLGTVCALERQTGDALGVAHGQARVAVVAAPARNVDETGWKQAGKRRWLWTAATKTVAYFVVHAQRGASGLIALLGAAITGVVVSDRWGGYNGLPLAQRQICWAHLKRDFQKCIDRGGLAKRVGDVGAAVVEDVFTLWRDFRQLKIDRVKLVEDLAPPIEELRNALERGAACADRKTARFCKNLLSLYPALWQFAAIDGIEPTNNHAERLLRGGVLWRKNSFGSQSDSGCRFVERTMTVVETLRLQGRDVLDFLERSIVAHRLGFPAPALVVPQTD
jgi:transposase